MEVLSDRLQLVKLELNHVKDFYKYRSDAETNKYQGWIPYALEDCSHFIKNKIATTINALINVSLNITHTDWSASFVKKPIKIKSGITAIS